MAPAITTTPVGEHNMPTNPAPVTPADFEATIPESTGSICTKLTALWSLANKVHTFFDWFLNDDGTLADEALPFFSSASVPTGSIVFWPMDVAPSGWLVANGATVSRTTYANLFAVYGVKYGAGDGTTTFVLPDMQRRFPFGASGTNVPGSTGGAESVTVLQANLPAIVPSFLSNIDGLVAQTISAGTNGLAAGSNISKLDAVEIFEPLGDEDPLDILNPYFSGHFICKL